MRFVYLSLTNSVLVGPVGQLNSLNICRTHDTYESRRSPWDPEESDFTHITSNWFGVRMNTPVNQDGKKVKFVVPHSSGPKTVSINPFFGPSGSMITTAFARWTSPLYPLYKDAISTWNTCGMNSAQTIAVTRNFSMSGNTSGRNFSLRRTIVISYVWSPRESYSKTFDTICPDAKSLNDLMEEEASWEIPMILAMYENILRTTVAKVLQASVVSHINFTDMDCSIESPYHLRPVLDGWDEKLVMGDLSQMCTDQIRATKVDTIVYAKEAPEVAQLVTALPNSPSDLLNPKFWASAYLAYKFGVESSYRDSVSLVDDISRAMRKRVMAKDYSTRRAVLVKSADYRDTRSSSVYRLKLKYNGLNDPLADAFRFLYDYNLMPSVTTAWALVPFSFVADWFLHIDKMLETVDFKGEYATLTVRSATYSKKHIITGPVQSHSGCYLPTIGTTTHYSREVRHHAIEPIPQFKATLPLNNWVTGSALVIQSAKK